MALSPGVPALSAPDWGQIAAWKLCQTGAPATAGKSGSRTPGILAPVGNFLLTWPRHMPPPVAAAPAAARVLKEVVEIIPANRRKPIAVRCFRRTEQCHPGYDALISLRRIAVSCDI